jgi:transposase
MGESYWAKPQVPRGQLVLFSPRLDDALAPDDEIRLLDDLLNEYDWSAWEARYERWRGQPPIHPRLVAGVIVFGLSRGIVSSRDLEESTSRRIDLIWFLEGRRIDHSTFCRFRQRFAEQLPGFFDEMAKQAALGPKAGCDVAVDGTRVRADSDRHGSRTAASLRRRLSEVAEKKGELLAEMDRLDGIDNGRGPDRTLGENETGEGQRDESDNGQTQSEPAESGESTDDPIRAALDKELSALESEQAKMEAALERAEERDAVKRDGEGPSATAVRVPVTDPDAHLLPNKEGGFAPNYTPVVAVDMASGAIVDAQVPDGADEAGTLSQIVESVEQRLGQKPENLVCDGNFSTGSNLEQLEQADVSLCSPCAGAAAPAAQRDDPSQPVDPSLLDDLPMTGRGKKRRLAREAFLYDEDQDCYYCPNGQPMKRVGQDQRKDKTGRVYQRWRYRSSNCSDCPLAQCCLSGDAKTRSVVRDVYQSHRDRQAARMSEPTNRTLYKKRAPIVEGVFGYIKHTMGIRRFQTRGRPSVRTEWLWICSTYNIAKILRRRRAEAIAARTGPDGSPKPTRRGPRTAMCYVCVHLRAFAASRRLLVRLGAL